MGVDLLRCESMASLDTATLNRLLQKNYRCVCVRGGGEEGGSEGCRGGGRREGGGDKGKLVVSVV